MSSSNDGRIRIAVASGKGGTGKTTVSCNLAKSIDSERVTLVDCDVEEPNVHLFFKEKNGEKLAVTNTIPDIDKSLCKKCSKCSEFCQFGALISIKGDILLNKNLCHSCGGCSIVCPHDAISTKARKIGEIEIRESKNLKLVSGRLAIGSTMSPAVITSVKERSRNDKVVIFDSPPGTSCNAVESMLDADFVLLVTDCSKFGLYDIKLSVDLVRNLEKPFAILINRYGLGDYEIDEYCKQENIDVIMRIPDDIKVARAYSKGILQVDYDEVMKAEFRKAYHKIIDIVSNPIDDSLKDLVNS